MSVLSEIYTDRGCIHTLIPGPVIDHAGGVRYVKNSIRGFIELQRNKKIKYNDRALMELKAR